MLHHFVDIYFVVQGFPVCLAVYRVTASACNAGFENDLWSFDIAGKLWTWQLGNNTAGTKQGSYGVQGVAVRCLSTTSP